MERNDSSFVPVGAGAKTGLPTAISKTAVAKDLNMAR